MNQPTSLYLAPRDANCAPPRETVIQALADLEIIGEPLDTERYAAGAGFTRHVVFAGCSPHLIMQPPADGSLRFCHVAVHGPYAAPRLVTGPNTVKPRCPHCRARFDDWRQRLATWQGGHERARCAACGSESLPTALDWRDHAVAGRLLVELRNVFPGEATPSDRLMHELAQCTATAWRYAWAAYTDSVRAD